MSRFSGSQAAIAPLRQRRLIAGLLQLEFDDATPLLLSVHVDALRLPRRLDREWLQYAQQFRADRSVDAAAAKPQAARQAEHQVGPVAPVYGVVE